MGAYTYLQPVHGAEPAGKEVDIDTSWFDLAEGLNAVGLDGEFIVTGNIFIATGDEDSDGGGIYERQLDPEEVQRNWQQLQIVTFERYLAAYQETPQGKGCKDPGIDNYLKAHFMALMDVYRRAADAAAGMKITAW
ncbi:DUF1877 family protein [Spirillospora sp. NBC_01491]|uniref:DUF1877 family protein n=1 Tax=Spirillospora sp. NBC_01491 TaxID=2976007 RepID=UPI002E35030A|nr:DUF1877 family protein [Spirillospora sp. NBC_01491]